MSSSRVSIDKLPALKMIFHASKHAECAVNGLLLCKPTADSNTGASTLRICDYVPLFHSALNLAPMLEVALCQVDSYCKQEGLRICGYFQANEHIDDLEPTPFACRVAEKIKERCDQAVLLMLRNDELYPPEDTSKFTAYSISQGRWQPTDTDVDESFTEALEEAMCSRKYSAICDFDDHLNDASCDYFNVCLMGCV